MDSIGGITCRIGSRMVLLHLLFQHRLWTINRRTCDSDSHNLCRYHNSTHRDILLHIIHIWHTSCRIPVSARKEIGILQENPLPARQHRAQIHHNNDVDLDFVRTIIHWTDKSHYILPLQHHTRQEHKQLLDMVRSYHRHSRRHNRDYCRRT